jgi:predicted PhzF superfamily epimerase YddE/YHI9
VKLRLYQVDAFSSERFRGNPAAVIVLGWFPDDAWMLAVADENHLSETAYVVAADEPGCYGLRWFTPAAEIELCGHATLASAWVLWERYAERSPVIRFQTRSGELRAARLPDGRVELDFPVRPVVAAAGDPVGAALGGKPLRVLDSGACYMAVYACEADVRALRPDFRALAAVDRHGIIATARGDTVDYVSRYFAPSVGIDEDPATGSSQCDLVPFCARELGRSSLSAQQVSRRGAAFECRLDGPRVRIAGAVAPYLEGEIDGP